MDYKGHGKTDKSFLRSRNAINCTCPVIAEKRILSSPTNGQGKLMPLRQAQKYFELTAGPESIFWQETELKLRTSHGTRRVQRRICTCPESCSWLVMKYARHIFRTNIHRARRYTQSWSWVRYRIWLEARALSKEESFDEDGCPGTKKQDFYLDYADYLSPVKVVVVTVMHLLGSTYRNTTLHRKCRGIPFFSGLANGTDTLKWLIRELSCRC